MPFMQIIREHQDVVGQLAAACMADIVKMARLCEAALTEGKTIYFCGNGGSAADCQHLAAELVGRFARERRGLAAAALTTDTSILTAVSNDYGYERVFARQVEALARAGDVVVGISTSGGSGNVAAALQAARRAGARAVGMTGAAGGRVARCADVCVAVPSRVTARVQEAHILIGHMICEYLDGAMKDVPE